MRRDGPNSACMVFAVNRMVKLMTSFRSEPGARRLSSRQREVMLSRTASSVSWFSPVHREIICLTCARCRLMKTAGRLRPSMSWISGEEMGEVAVVRLRWLESVECLLFLVVLAKRLAELRQWIDTLPCRDRRPLPCDLAHQLRRQLFELLWPASRHSVSRQFDPGPNHTRRRFQRNPRPDGSARTSAEDAGHDPARRIGR